MIAHHRHRGVVVPMASPFSADGTIDEAAAERLADRLACEAIGIFVLGTTGETASIPHRERLRLVRAVVRAASDRVPVYAGIGDNCLRHSIEGAARYGDAGVSAVVAHLPCYYPLSADEMYDYFLLLHAEIDGGIILYNIPQTTHMSIPVKIVERLCDLPRIVGFKDSERLLDRARESIRRCGGRIDFSLFMGSTALAVSALRLGFDGLVPSSGNYEPRLWRLLMEAANRKDWDMAERFQTYFDALNQIFQGERSLGQSIAALKIGLHLRDICQPYVLPPLQAVTPDECETIRRRLAALPGVADC